MATLPRLGNGNSLAAYIGLSQQSLLSTYRFCHLALLKPRIGLAGYLACCYIIDYTHYQCAYSRIKNRLFIYCWHSIDEEPVHSGMPVCRMRRTWYLYETDDAGCLRLLFFCVIFL